MQALYRKYRPKNFEEMVGQKTIIDTLKNQVISGDIAHAYLFLGTRGTGKTSAAKILARAVNCEDPQGGNPCNKCPSCKGILEERILDVIEMDAASNNSVDDIRELKDKAAYPPSYTKKKVYIIDEVHMLSKGAFNALLKILEEPPKHMIFILATTEPQKIPPTIISRTQRFTFNRLKEEDIVCELERIMQRENLPFEKSALGLIANHSDGSLRDALSILDQTLHGFDEILNDQVVKNTLGLTDQQILERIVDGILANDPSLLLDQVEMVYRRSANMPRFLESIMARLRDLLVVKSTGHSPFFLSQEEKKALLDQANEFTYEQLFQGIDILNESNRQIRFAQDAKLFCEVAILKLLEVYRNPKAILSPELSSKDPASFSENGKIPEKKEFPPRREKQQPDTPNTRKKEDSKDPLKNFSTNAIMGKDTNKNTEELQPLWEDLLKKIRTIRPSTHALLKEARLFSIDNNQLVVSFKEGYDFHKLAVENSNNKEIILQAAQEIFGDIREFKTILQEEKESNLDQLVEVFGKENIEFIDE